MQKPLKSVTFALCKGVGEGIWSPTIEVFMSTCIFVFHVI